MNEIVFLRKILVPIDDSVSSLLAQETSALIAKKSGSFVTVLHVVPEFQSAYDYSQSTDSEIRHSVERRSEAILSKASALFSEENVAVDVITSRGEPAITILDFQSRDYNLTVMGSCGENETDLCKLGSVAKKVLKYARLPVLIVKKTGLLSNFLVGTDGSENSIEALIFSTKLAQLVGAKITLLNVQERLPLTVSSRSAEEMGEDVLTATLNAASPSELEVSRRLEFGTPSNVIIDMTEEGKYDLIVLGSRGLGTAEQSLLGSTSDDVSQNAKCSVLIVPQESNRNTGYFQV